MNKELGVPEVGTQLPELMVFAWGLAGEYRAGSLHSWEALAERVHTFFTPERLDAVEAVIPGWREMASYGDGVTLVHVICALIGLLTSPEYGAASPEQREQVTWVILLHDLAKWVRDGERDSSHAFRSAALAGAILLQAGFPVTDAYGDGYEPWATLAREAVIVREGDKTDYVHDNEQLPEIIEGVERLYGQDTPTALIVKTILLHTSINVLQEWPQAAPLTEGETERYLTPALYPLLRMTMLADNDGWELFNASTREAYRQQTLAVYDRLAELTGAGSAGEAGSFEEEQDGGAIEPDREPTGPSDRPRWLRSTRASALTGALPRISLAHLPTPLEEMPRLTEALGGGPRLWIKRDDQTGLATGGNKARKLEFLVAEALEQGADTLVTMGAAQSNHCRQTAAAAAKVGLRCVLVLSGEPPPGTWTGNLLLSVLLGAELSWTFEWDHWTEAQATVARLREEGARPFFFGVGGSVPTGAAGYVAAVEELHEQLQARDLHMNRIVVASGSAGTQAGILVGVKALGMETRVEGMAVSFKRSLLAEIQELAPATAAHLGLDLEFTRQDYILHRAYAAPGYANITDAERAAIHLLARTEGILADPVYTGRALAGLIDMLDRSAYRKHESVLFWHTGGVAGLFARAGEVR